MTILNVADIQARLLTIFPEGTEQRTYLTREMAAKTVFTALYASAIDGLDRWIRPNQVCRMTDAQTLLLDDGARETWYVESGKNGYFPQVGPPWFADTTREPIRDETIRRLHPGSGNRGAEGLGYHVEQRTLRPGSRVRSSLRRWFG